MKKIKRTIIRNRRKKTFKLKVLYMLGLILVKVTFSDLVMNQNLGWEYIKKTSWEIFDSKTRDRAKQKVIV